MGGEHSGGIDGVEEGGSQPSACVYIMAGTRHRLAS